MKFQCYNDCFIFLFIFLLQVAKSYTLQNDNSTLQLPNKHEKEQTIINKQDVTSLPKEEVTTILPANSTQAPFTVSQPAFNGTVTVFQKNINTDAVFRGFYVVLALGSVFLVYIGIKTFRLRRHRAVNKYKVIATKGEDRESFFPLAAEDGEEEEIFNASIHQGYT